MKKGIFIESIRLARKFPKKVVTHAVEDKYVFLKILKDNKIKLPAENSKLRKMTPYMEKILGIDNCIYLGLGFVYNSSHHNWKYSFIFNKNILLKKNITTFSAFLISNGWLRFLRKAKQDQPELLINIKNRNKRTKEEISRLFETDRCNWFHIEKELSEVFDKYKYKKEHIDYLKNFQRKHTIKNSYAPRYLAIEYHLNPNFKKFEAISNKSINLKDKTFIGVFIHESDKKTIQEVKSFLPKGKIIFTGKKIIKT